MSKLDMSARTLTKFFRIASLGTTLIGLSACDSIHVQQGTVLGSGRAVLDEGKPSLSFDLEFRFDPEADQHTDGAAQAAEDNHDLRERMFEELSALEGLREIPGTDHTSLIQAMHMIVGLKNEADETPWCSSAINFVAQKVGVEGTGSAAARSWLTWSNSRAVSLEEAQPGDVVVFWRESPTSWKGHVGLYVGHRNEAGTILVLGGNQGDAVNISTYPIERLLGVRRVTSH